MRRLMLAGAAVLALAGCTGQVSAEPSSASLAGCSDNETVSQCTGATPEPVYTPAPAPAGAYQMNAGEAGVLLPYGYNPPLGYQGPASFSCFSRGPFMNRQGATELPADAGGVVPRCVPRRSAPVVEAGGSER